MLDNISAAAKTSGIPQSSIWIADNLGQSIPSGFKSFKDLMNYGEEDWVRFDDEKTCKETTAARLFSSGTTGMEEVHLDQAISKLIRTAQSCGYIPL